MSSTTDTKATVSAAGEGKTDITTKSFVGADNTLGNLDGVAEQFTERITGNKDIFSQIDVLRA